MTEGRGYFGIGVERISKPMNVGNLFRSAHAFGADFVFAIAPAVDLRAINRSDTSQTAKHLPFYEYASVDEMTLPRDCRLVGVELLDEAADLPSFTHPQRAAYVLGPERGALSPALLDRCDFTVRIPTRFCVNVGIAGAILMYDRMLARRRFAPRPVRAGGPTEALPGHRHGGPVLRRRRGGT
ncbi:MAG: RNA methyltransferase [Rhodospirillales bacterium]|nr:MAG: RNA methyltransferase [Rhodospirillales bacterium]